MAWHGSRWQSRSLALSVGSAHMQLAINSFVSDHSSERAGGRAAAAFIEKRGEAAKRQYISNTQKERERAKKERESEKGGLRIRRANSLEISYEPLIALSYLSEGLFPTYLCQHL